jgi:hypothetical protein
MNCEKCGRVYEVKQVWIHVPTCRYVEDVEPNHVPPELRKAVTPGTICVTPRVLSVTQDAEIVTVGPLSNAERQRRYREKGRSDAVN